MVWETDLINALCVHAKLFQSCLTLCDPMDCSPPGSSVHGILQARILEWVATRFFRGSSLDLLLFLLHWQAGSLLLLPPGKPLNTLYNFLKSGIIWWQIKGSRQERDLVDSSILPTNLMQKHLFFPFINIPAGQCTEEHPLRNISLRSGRRKASSFLEVPRFCGWPLLLPSWTEMHSWFTKVWFMNLCSWAATSLASQMVLVVKNPPAKAGNTRDRGSVPG